MNYRNFISKDKIKAFNEQVIFFSLEENNDILDKDLKVLPPINSFGYLVYVPNDDLDEEFLDIMSLFTNKGVINYWTNFRRIRKEAYKIYCNHNNFQPDFESHWKDFYKTWITSDIVEYAKEKYRSSTGNPMKYNSDWKYIDIKNLVNDFVLNNPEYWVSGSYVFYNS